LRGRNRCGVITVAMPTNHLRVEISSDCAPAREHPENEKVSIPEQIRLTDSSNVAALFSSVCALLQGTCEDFKTILCLCDF
jgi:hypothetical protein